MDILIITILLIAAVLLFLAELFLLPGISIAGFLAGGCALYANYYAFAHLGDTGGFITLGITVVGCIASLVLFMRSKTLDKIALKKEIKGAATERNDKYLKVGDTGITTTRLALIGHAIFSGHIIEVRSADGFIDEKTPVCVVRISNGTVFVVKEGKETSPLIQNS